MQLKQNNSLFCPLQSCFPKALPLPMNAQCPTEALLSPLQQCVLRKTPGGNPAKTNLLLKTLSELPFWFTRLFANRTKNYMLHSV